MQQHIACTSEAFLPIGVDVRDIEENGEHLLRVVKAERFDEFDIDTYARARDVTFHNGVIELELKSRLLPDAPAFARGFVGLVFRANGANAEFESFYVRPDNGRDCTDDVRVAHGCQYFSYPGYTFGYFRHHGIEGFEAPVPDIALDEWMRLRVEVRDDVAALYVNGASEPALQMEQLKHGANAHGGVGVFVDTGTEALVRSLTVTCWD